MTAPPVLSSVFDLSRLPEHDRFVAEPSDIAYVSGSRLAGFGNARSDLDLFVVYEDPARAKGAPRMFILDEFRVDMERYSRTALDEVARAVNEVDLADPVAVLGLAHATIDLYYRTAIGEPVANGEGFHALLEAFDRERCRAVYARWAACRAASLLAEARALLASPHPDRAYLRARRALSLAVDSFAASEDGGGDGYPSAKWCFVKLARRFGHDAPEFRRPWALKARGDRTVEAYVAEVAAYASSVGVPSAVAGTIEEARLARDPQTVLFEVGARPLLVQRKTRVFELNPVGLRAWRLFDGARTLGEVVETLLAEGFPNREAVTSHLARFATQLRDDGLLLGDLYPARFTDRLTEGAA